MFYTICVKEFLEFITNKIMIDRYPSQLLVVYAVQDLIKMRELVK